MMQHNNKSFWKKLQDKGYYIALILCIVAVGVSGYLYYQAKYTPNVEAPENLSVSQPSLPLEVVAPTDGNSVQVGPGVNDETTPVVAADEGKPSAVMPIADGTLLTKHAMDHLEYNITTRDWRVHNGVDFAAELGQEVMAAADGTVYAIYEDDSLGNTIVIRHAGNYVTHYSNLAKEVAVSVGDTVTKGTIIGTVGDTALAEVGLASHLHFAVICNHACMDPETFLA